MPIQNLIDNNILLSIESGSLITHLNDGQSDNDRSRLVFEFYVYDIDTNELLDKSIIKVLDEWNRSIFISSDKLLLNPGMHLRSLGYSAGVYKIRYKFFKNLVGEHDGEKLHLKRISPSRNELELIPPEDINLIIEGIDNGLQELPGSPGGAQSFTGIRNDYINFITQLGEANKIREFKTYLNFDFNRTFLIINAKDPVNMDLLLKLNDPLDNNIEPISECWICEELLPQYEDKLVLYTETLPDTSKLNYLRPANINYNDAQIHFRTTPLENFEDLVTTNREKQNEIVRHYLSSSLIEGIELNTDYRKYENFVKFSSIKQRLINFRQKIRNIEFYEARINQYYTGSIGSASLQTPEISSSIDYYRNLKQNTINEFDNYERFLYYDSASYESSSVGEFVESSWPKYTDTQPYLLYSYTSSQVQQWYTGQIDSASVYDNLNKDLFSNFVPLEMQLDDQNKDFVKFVNMNAHYYDIVNNYIKEIPSWHYKDNSIDEGIPKDLIIHAINHYGFDLRSGQVLKSLDDYIIQTSSDFDFTPDFTPDLVNGLLVWIDASDTGSITFDSNSRVTQIGDRSGHGNIFYNDTGSFRPYYKTNELNGNNSIFFSSSISSSLRNINNSISASFISGSSNIITVFELLKMYNVTSQHLGIISFGAPGNTPSNGQYIIGRGNGPSFQFGFNETASLINFGVYTSYNTWSLFEYSYDYNGITNFTLTASILENGILSSSYSGSVSKSFIGNIDDSSFIRIGAREYNNDSFGTQDVGEILVYYTENPITNNDKNKIEQYFVDKWNY